MTRYGQRRPALFDRLTIAKTADELDDRAARVVQIGHQLLTEWQVDFRRNAVPGQRLEVRWKHAKHGVRTAVEGERSSDDIWVTTEPPLPETMTEDRHVGVPFGSGLVRREGAADRHRDVEHVEKVRRHNQRNQADR